MDEAKTFGIGEQPAALAVYSRSYTSHCLFSKVNKQIMIPRLETYRTGAGDNNTWPFQPSWQKGLEWPCLDRTGPSKSKDEFQKKNVLASDKARTYLQPHHSNGVNGNVYLSAGQH